MKTASEWYTEACNVQGQHQLSLEYSNKALEIDPNYSQAYYMKGLALAGLGQKQEAINSFDKSISLNANLYQAYYCKGNTLVELGKSGEALECFNKAIAIKPDFSQGYYVKGNILAGEKKYHEAIELFDKAISLDPNLSQAYYTKGNALVDLKRTEEAVACFDQALALNPNFSQAYYVKGNYIAAQLKYQEAIEFFDKALSLDPGLKQAYYTKGNALAALKKTEEAIANFDKALSLDPEFNQAYYTKGNALVDLGRTEEAYGFFTKGIELDTNNVLYYCGRARCLTNLGRQQEALKDFAKAQELLKSGNVSSILQEEHIKYVENTLKSIVELHNMSDEAETKIKELEAQKDNPLAKKFAAKMQLLVDQKNKIAGKMVGHFGKDNTAEMKKDQDELAKLKKQFQEEMEAMKAEISNIKTDVKELKNNMVAVKEDLNTKMNDYKAKLDVELAKRDLSDDEKTILREYYRAFLETFSSTFVTAQVVDSGQVNLALGSTTTSILSTLASYAPLIGGVLSSGISTIGDFLQTKEMITSARKMKGLAADSTELSQLIGKSGYDIVLHADKQKKILVVTDAELEAQSADLLGKIRDFCQKMSDDIDVYQYTRLYKTPAARLGHMDANTLIELWVSDQISPYNTQKAFVEKIVVEEKEEVSPGTANPQKEIELEENPKSASGCNCNMF